MNKYEKMKIYGETMKKAKEEFDASFPQINEEEMEKNSEKVAKWLADGKFKKTKDEDTRPIKNCKATG